MPLETPNNMMFLTSFIKIKIICYLLLTPKMIVILYYLRALHKDHDTYSSSLCIEPLIWSQLTLMISWWFLFFNFLGFPVLSQKLYPLYATGQAMRDELEKLYFNDKSVLLSLPWSLLLGASWCVLFKHYLMVELRSSNSTSGKNVTHMMFTI